jgi:hypothetical protein
MNYKADLIERVLDNTKWPVLFDRPEYLDKLHGIANQAFDKGSIEGFLAALLIYQQLSEVIIQYLLEEAHFLIQLRVFPNEIHFPTKKRLMFGKVIVELRSTITFIQKEEIIKDCETMNEYRVKFVHSLTMDTTLENIAIEVQHVKDLYGDIMERTKSASLYFVSAFAEYQNKLIGDEKSALQNQK